MIQPTFINTFQKGATENANIGTGTFLGVETYSKKGVIRLTKDTVKVSGSAVTDLPIFFTLGPAAGTSYYVFAQGDTGKVYFSNDGGASWSDVSNSGNSFGSGKGRGIIYYDGVLYAFFNGTIQYSKDYGANWAYPWNPNGGTLTLTGTYNTPFIFPSAYGFYFANGNYVGLLQEKTPGTSVDPASTSTYYFNEKQLTLPSFYEVTCLSFLPPSQLMIGTKSSSNPQVADIIGWDTVSLNKFSPPLRLYSNAVIGESGVTQLINRNNVLYAVTGGSHSVYQTNGSTFTIVSEMALRTNYRKTTGEQATTTVFLNPYPQAIAVLGNKLLTGVSASTNSSIYAPSGYALSPMGVWSLAFTDNDIAVQCEFTLSSGVTRSNTFKIGSLFTMDSRQILIGWYDGTNYGIDQSLVTTYQNDGTQVVLESAMMEIGTPLNPSPAYNSIEINLVRNLLAGQSISIYARTAFDQPYTLIQTFDTSTWTGDLNALQTTINPLGQSRYLQIYLSINTGSPNEAFTPEVRTIIVK